MPQAGVEAALRGSSVWVLSAIALTALLAFALALLIGRRIAGDVGWLALFAKTMAEPRRAPEPRLLAMTEAASVRTALEDTGRELRERQDKLNAAIDRETQARAAAESANRAKDRFLAMLGHELRNPLSAISTAAALLEPGIVLRTNRASADTATLHGSPHWPRTRKVTS